MPRAVPALVLTALAVAGLYIGSIFTPYAALWGAVPVTAGLLGWAWPRKGKPPSEVEQDIARSGEPRAEHV